MDIKQINKERKKAIQDSMKINKEREKEKDLKGGKKELSPISMYHALHEDIN